MYLNYSLKKTFSLFINSIIDYRISKIFILCLVLLWVILYVNRNSKISKFLVLFIDIILISMIIYFYNDIFLHKIFINFMHNIYFYFLNSILYLVLRTICLFKNIKYKKLLISFYVLSLLFLQFSLFMTSYLNNIRLVVIGNIYPMIVYGNYLYLLFYVLIIIYILKNVIMKK